MRNRVINRVIECVFIISDRVSEDRGLSHRHPILDDNRFKNPVPAGQLAANWHFFRVARALDRLAWRLDRLPAGTLCRVQTADHFR